MIDAGLCFHYRAAAEHFYDASWGNRIEAVCHQSIRGEQVQTGQPSHTARGAAAYRAIHQTLDGGVIFSDPLAARILDDETRARLDETAADPSLRPWRLFIAARSRFSEDTLAGRLARGVRQAGVLGAGLDRLLLRHPHACPGGRTLQGRYPSPQ